MIDGITILSQSEIMELVPNMSAIVIAFFISLVFFIGITYFGTDDIGTTAIVSIFWIIVALLIGSIAGLATGEKVPTGIIEYKVLIEESVSFEQVYEQYEIIEQDGEIWILQDKETKE